MDGLRRSRWYSEPGTDGLRSAQCEGKEQFNEKMARYVAGKQRRKNKQISAYKCPFCKQWHIGAMHEPKGK